MESTKLSPSNLQKILFPLLVSGALAGCLNNDKQPSDQIFVIEGESQTESKVNNIKQGAPKTYIYNKTQDTANHPTQDTLELNNHPTQDTLTPINIDTATIDYNEKKPKPSKADWVGIYDDPDKMNKLLYSFELTHKDLIKVVCHPKTNHVMSEKIINRILAQLSPSEQSKITETLLNKAETHTQPGTSIEQQVVGEHYTYLLEQVINKKTTNH